VTAGGGVPVSLLYFDGCPHWQLADERLREALARVGRPDAPIEYLTVTTPEQADELRFTGSPTVLVNGRDSFVDRAAPVGLSCRVYRTNDGLAGSPTVEQLVEALEPATATGDSPAAEPAGSGQPSAQATQQRADHRPGVPAASDDQASDSPEEVSPAGCR
jgi:hypothetical protein